MCALCPPTAARRERLRCLGQTGGRSLRASIPPPPPTHTHKHTHIHTHTCIHLSSDRPVTNHNGTMTYKPQPHRNYSQAFKSDSIKSQLQQERRVGVRGGDVPNPTLCPCILTHHCLMSSKQKTFMLNTSALFPAYCILAQIVISRGQWSVSSSRGKHKMTFCSSYAGGDIKM